MKDRVKALLDDDKADEAISLLERFRAEGGPMDDTLFYLLGNAMNNYLEAVHINRDSPARQALDIANEILDFYNKDMYNQ